VALVSIVAALTCVQAPAAVAGGNPFLHAHLYVDPNSDAANQARKWSHSRPRAAAQMRKIAPYPVAQYWGDWVPDPGQSFQWYTKNVWPAGTTAFIAPYDLPHRDCSGVFSRGGAANGAAYKRWIDKLVRGIGSYPTIAVVEPDGLPDTGCLSGGARSERLGLIAYATKKLAGLPHTTVYIDAGHSDWLSAAETISLLGQAGVRYARGFALNVTGYARTADELAYGDRISRALGGKYFIVNTSRNGRGPWGSGGTSVQRQWCNTPGRGLGARPTTRTSDAHADAFEWVLHPGYSDGHCEGGPDVGTWWPEYALGLASRSSW
jgi:endoglucanase